MYAAIDFGLTNLDMVVIPGAGEWIFASYPNTLQPLLPQMEDRLGGLGFRLSDFVRIAVTGGQHRTLPPFAGQTPLIGVNEVEAIGRGGLYLSGLEEALVVSAGSGTAMVAARPGNTRHSTGSAVGGGTMQGLGQLLLGTSDAQQINALAQAGDANRVDLTLAEATGGAVGSLPPDANAVNFGRLARQTVDLSPQDLAAGIVRMVGQVIAIIAINAARAEHLESVVFVGHLVDMPSMRQVLSTVAGYYGASFVFPQRPGYGTVIGSLLGSNIKL